MDLSFNKSKSFNSCIDFQRFENSFWEDSLLVSSSSLLDDDSLEKQKQYDGYEKVTRIAGRLFSSYLCAAINCSLRKFSSFRCCDCKFCTC